MRIVVLGSGQLAQMLYLAGTPLGMDVCAIDVKAMQVVHPVTKQVINTSVTEAFDDYDVITAEFEHIPEPLLQQAENTGKLQPSATAIRVGADRVKEKALLDKLGIKNSQYQVITDISQLDDCVAALGDNLVLKASRDGYDGYGQWRLTSRDQLEHIKDELSSLDLQAVPIIAEQCINFSRELSVIGARNRNGEVVVYPLAENDHHQGQLHVSIAPAQHTESLQAEAEEVFHKLANELDYVGVLAVEFFDSDAGLLVNELAPRVHNSGHWSMNGAVTSQFENHMRAVMNLPLGSTQAIGTAMMLNVIGYPTSATELNQLRKGFLHWYGKEAREKRKLAHINLVANSNAELAEALTAYQAKLPERYFPRLAATIERLK